MQNGPFKLVAIVAIIAIVTSCRAQSAHTITITIPRHSSLTFVQRLNREGVKAIERHDYATAAGFFYKAYLYDPADPFTLNNLAYISEVQGQMDRAESFYKLAAEQGCNANIDMSNVDTLKGQPMRAALATLRDTPMHVDRLNLDAVRLLSKNRAMEAAGLLQQALASNPNDPFTLNNLGVANEAIGNYQTAMRYYGSAADTRSKEPVALSQNSSSEGKSVSEIARTNARRLQNQLRGTGSNELESYELSMRGVIAENENNWQAARQDFMKAYSLDPANAFSLNNRGYVAEKDGDLESAQYFYQKAWQADGAGLRVGLATNRAEEGQPLSIVSTDSDQKVSGSLAAYSRQRKEQTAPVELTPRGGSSGEPELQPRSPNGASAPPASPQPNNQ